MNWKLLVIFPALIFLTATQIVAAPSPMEVVRAGTDEVLQILKTRPPGEERSAELRRIAEKYVDFEEMARRSLGGYWKRQPKEKQAEFVDVFSEFLFNRYLTQVEKNQDVAITYKGQTEEGGLATVYTVADTPEQGSAGLDYRLHMEDGVWKAYDVVIEGVSLVNNYRSQFRSILARQSFDDLLKMLREKNRKIT